METNKHIDQTWENWDCRRGQTVSWHNCCAQPDMLSEPCGLVIAANADHTLKEEIEKEGNHWFNCTFKFKVWERAATVGGTTAPPYPCFVTYPCFSEIMFGHFAPLQLYWLSCRGGRKSGVRQNLVLCYLCTLPLAFLISRHCRQSDRTSVSCPEWNNDLPDDVAALLLVKTPRGVLQLRTPS